jgi:Tfp pilus assembly protein PilV
MRRSKQNRQHKRQHQRHHAGVALIEALIALAIMAFGMLAVAGMQASLRQNGDTSRQRAEAVRIAQAEMERWRSFYQLAPAAPPAVADPHSYSTLASGVGQPATVNGSNATYTVTLTVPQGAGLPSLTTPQQLALKTLVVEVKWVDRNKDEQKVRLSSTIHGVAPELAGTLSIWPNGGRTSSGGGRHPDIPWNKAVSLGNGTTAWMPPQGFGGNVAWVFNNLTGLFRICTVLDISEALALNNLVCSEVRAQLLSGFVNFASDGAGKASATDAMVPTGTPFTAFVRVKRTAPSELWVDETNGCFTTVPAPGEHSLRYFCAVPVSQLLNDPNKKWSGTAYVAASSLPVSPVAARASASCMRVVSNFPKAMPSV